MPIKQVIQSQCVPVKIWTDDVDARARQQLANIASLPFIHYHVAAMPNVRVGRGATIGSSVIATVILPICRGQRSSYFPHLTVSKLLQTER